jgi:hypothetical protein
MMLIGMLMQLKVERDDIRGMQRQGNAYAQRTILREKAMSNIIQLSKPCAFCDSRKTYSFLQG